ncbi:MAG: cytochrome c3 family protein [Spirochaetes bacterium]|nr:cytochrome c3 family protein [Spirochaetota bacterium]
MNRSSLIVVIIVALCIGLVIGISMKSCNYAQADEATPIPFIHKTHIEEYGIKNCGTCHKYDKIGRFQGLPTIGECTACHSRDGELINKDHMSPRKKTMFDAYTDKDRPWTSRAKKQELVYYSHKVAASATMADGSIKLRCVSCHGDKATPAAATKLEGKQLMDQCMDCHAARKLVNACVFCHN